MADRMRRAPRSLQRRAGELVDKATFPARHRRSPVRGLNIGSGRRRWPGWICLDEADDVGVTYMRFDADSAFPIPDSHVPLAYSSHFLEHVPDDVVDQVLSETFRCLEPGGVLVLKIPDFDYFLASYSAGDTDAFEQLGIDEIRHTWDSHGIVDSRANRLVMMFCGYMNGEYGSHFTDSPVPRRPSAFHGPPRISEEELQMLIDETSGSPHAIAAALRERASSEGDVALFNHQNAWSASELHGLLMRHGFEVGTWDSHALETYRPQIRDLDAMGAWTLYTIARRPV